MNRSVVLDRTLKYAPEVVEIRGEGVLKGRDQIYQVKNGLEVQIILRTPQVFVK